MITSLRLNGVKVFIDADPIPLRPLTLLTGVNSAGKSTIFQALLLLKQAFEHPTRGVAGMPLNGPRICMGDYADFSTNRESGPIDMHLSYQLPRQAILDRLDELPSRGWSAEAWWNTWLREAFGHVNWSGSLDLRLREDPRRPGSARLIRAEWTSELQRGPHETRYKSTLEIDPSSFEPDGETDAVEAVAQRQVASEGPLRIESSALGGDGGLEITTRVDGLSPVSVVLSADRTARRDLLEDLTREAVDAILGSQAQSASPAVDVSSFGNELRNRLSAYDDFAVELVEALKAPESEGGRALGDAEWIGGHMPDPGDDSVVGAVPWAELEAERLTEPPAFNTITRLIRSALPCVSGIRREHMKKRLMSMAPGKNAPVPLGEPGRRRFIAFDRWLEREQQGKPSFSGAAADIPVEGQISRLLVDCLFHLGALRDEPRNLYATAEPAYAADIGSRGERTIACIERFGRQPTLCPSPFGEGPATYCTLADAVAQWGLRLGVISELTVEAKSKHGFECHIRTPSAMSEVLADPNNVGVGVSQVLPVLWLCLAAPVGSTILIEQPELHLHPAVQNRLAVFFAACIFTGRQIVVETHSEHLVHRLRLLVAEGHLHPSDDIGLLYVEPSPFGAQVTSVEIAPTGELPAWPKGFFDETEKTLAALMRARFAPRESEQ